MPAKVFVGNLNFSATKEDVQNLFSKYGQVEDIAVQAEGSTRVARVKMGNEKQAAAAIKQLNGTKMGGNVLVVKAG